MKNNPFFWLKSLSKELFKSTEVTSQSARALFILLCYGIIFRVHSRYHWSLSIRMVREN